MGEPTQIKAECGLDPAHIHAHHVVINMYKSEKDLGMTIMRLRYVELYANDACTTRYQKC